MGDERRTETGVRQGSGEVWDKRGKAKNEPGDRSEMERDDEKRTDLNL